MPQHPSRQDAGKASVVDGQPTVHKEVADAGGILVRPVISGPIAKCFRIENNDVREVGLLQITALGKLQDVRGQAAAGANGLFERDDLVFESIAADLARKSPIASRMRNGGGRNLGT